jgi:hypothetical protein
MQIQFDIYVLLRALMLLIVVLLYKLTLLLTAMMLVAKSLVPSLVLLIIVSLFETVGCGGTDTGNDILCCKTKIALFRLH